MPQPPTPIPETHQDRQNEILQTLENLGIKFYTCIRCKAESPRAQNIHELIQVSECFDVILDKATRRERESNNVTFLNDPRRRTFRLVYITCKRCGFRSEFDLDKLQLQ